MENKPIKFLTDEDLWESTKHEAQVERNSTLKVIAYLQEIYSRRLHLRRGFSSLHEYCVNVLKYFDGGAHRRIKAMQLVEEVPEIRVSIETGTLNLTTASQLQRVFEAKQRIKKPMAKEEKLDLFYKIESKSKREVEKIIAVVCPEVVTQVESQKYIAPNKVQKTIVITEELNDKIDKLKKLRAHENKDFAVILEELVDRELKRVDPLLKSPKSSQPLIGRPSEPVSTVTGASPEKLHQGLRSRYVSAGIRKEVWKRSNGQCAYTDSKTGKRCGSTYWLQVDHVNPFAKGGPTALENLRLLCANHNRLLSRDHFGIRRIFGVSI